MQASHIKILVAILKIKFNSSKSVSLRKIRFGYLLRRSDLSSEDLYIALLQLESLGVIKHLQCSYELIW